MSRTWKSATDGELLCATRGNPDAFAEFYRRHERLVMGFMLRRTGRADTAADLTAEVFAAALGAAGRFKPDGPPATAWLVGVARNTLGTSIRKGRVEDEARRRLQIERVTLTDETLERIETLDVDAALQEALTRLPADQRSAVYARIVEEEDYPVLARNLKCSEAVARQRVSRGLRALRASLTEARS